MDWGLPGRESDGDGEVGEDLWGGGSQEWVKWDLGIRCGARQRTSFNMKKSL